MAGPMEIRVTVGDSWMPRVWQASSTDTVASLKRKALDAEKIDLRLADRYEVKAGGGVIRDESRTLSAAGVRPGAPLVILARRRRPVR